MSTYDFSLLLKGLQEGERALAAIQMIGNGTIKERAYAMTGATASTVAYMTKLGVTSAAELTFTQRLRLSTMALWEQAAAWVASPLGMATIAAVTIFALVKAVDWFSKSVERSREKLSELKEEFDEISSELSSTEDELISVAARIDELNAKDKLSFTEKEELGNLQAQNRELQRTIDLLKLEQEIKQEEVYKSFIDTMNKDLNRSDMLMGDPGIDTRGAQWGTEKEYIEQQFEEYHKNLKILSALDAQYKDDLTNKQYQSDKKRIEDANKKISDYLISKTMEFEKTIEGKSLSYVQNPMTDYAKAVNDELDYIGEIQDRTMITLGRDNAKANAFSRLINTTFADVTADLKELGTQGAVTADHLNDPKYDEFIQTVQDLGIASGDTAEVIDLVALAFNNFGNTSSDAFNNVFSDALVATRKMREEIRGLLTDFGSGYDAHLLDYRLYELSSDELNHVYDLVVNKGVSAWEDIESALHEYRVAAAEAAYESRILHKSYSELQDEISAVAVIQRSTNDVFADKTYITEDVYNSIVKLVGSEESLAGCIDKTNGFLVTNASELNKLIDVSNEALKENVKIAESHEKLNYHELTDQLRDVVSSMQNYDQASMRTVRTLLDQIDATEMQIAKYKLLEHQLLGATNAFGEFEEAQKLDNESDYTDDLSTLIGGLLSSFENKEFGSETFWTSLESLVPKDIYGQFEDAGAQIDAGWKYINEKLSRYFTSEGNGNVSVGFDNVKAFAADALATSYGDSTVFTGSIDSFELNESIETIEQLADAMGVTTTVAFTLGNAISKYSADNKDFLSSLSVESLEGKIYAADQKLVELLEHQAELGESGQVGTSEWYEVRDAISAANSELDDLAAKARDDIASHIEYDSNIIEAQKEVDNLHAKLQGMDESHVEYEATFENYTEAEAELASLLQKKYDLDAPTELTIQVALEQVQGDIDNAQSELNKIADFDGKVYTAKVGIDQGEVDGWVAKIQGLQEEQTAIQCYAGIDDEDVMASLETIQNYNIDDKDFSVTANLGDTLLRLQRVIDKLKYIRDLSASVSAPTIGPGRAYGSAFAKGSWGIPTAEQDALVGELGQELVVDPRSGKYQTVGDHGAELVNLPSGAIVFNHKQTEGLLKNRRINSRGIAYASGNAHFTLLDGNYSLGGSGSSSANRPSNSGGYSSGYRGGSSVSESTAKSSGSSKDESEFERLYKYHQHLLAMDKESVEEYLKWLNEAYKAAYKAGEIELDDFYKYEEEVHDKLQDLFKDYLSDIEHEISMRENYEGETKTILNLYQNMLDAIVKEIAAARAAGLDDTDDYIQELQKQWQDYSESVKEIQEDITNEAKDAVDELIDFRIDMIKKDLENEKDAIGEKLEYLRDFYQNQKDLLQESYDEEKYLEEQTEKRKSVSALEEELARLDYDNSAWAQKRKLELQEELADARKELNDFEKDHALQIAQEELDAQLALQEKEIEAEQALIDDKLNNAKALYEQALDDIRNGSVALYEEMIEYNALMGTGVDEDVTQMWKAAYTALQDYYDLYKEHYKDIRLANATGEVATDKGWDDAVISGSKPITQTTASSSSGSSSSNSSASPSLSKGASVTIKSSATHFGSKSGGVRMAAFVPGGTYTVYQTSGNEVLIGRNGAYTGWVKKTDIVGYASGTKHATVGIHEVDERGVEYIFESPSDGSRYRMFTGGEKVLNAKATDFLYNFATTGGGVLSNMFANAFKAVGLTGLTGRAQTVNLTTGNVIVQGNAEAQTVSEIRRAQRDSISYMLKEFNKLNK